ncbi:MAG: hypothetical protein AAFQ90_03995 [Pseudomonadota bacterium]
MATTDEFPAITVEIGGRSVRLVTQRQWRSAIRRQQITPDSSIIVEDRMLARDCAWLRPSLEEFEALAEAREDEGVSLHPDEPEIAEEAVATPSTKAREETRAQLAAMGAKVEALENEIEGLRQTIADHAVDLDALKSTRDVPQPLTKPQPHPLATPAPKPAAKAPASETQAPPKLGKSPAKSPAKAKKPETPKSAVPKQKAIDASFATGRFAKMLIERVHDGRRDDLDGWRKRHGVATYTNDRRGDLAEIFPSMVDRFWLRANPHEPSQALLIPGMQVRHDFHRYRSIEAGHPLSHHFKLVPGERFALIRAAILRREDGGKWVLAEKGEVSGFDQ